MVFLGRKNICNEMVTSGHAFVYRQGMMLWNISFIYFTFVSWCYMVIMLHIYSYVMIILCIYWYTSGGGQYGGLKEVFEESERKAKERNLGIWKNGQEIESAASSKLQEEDSRRERQRGKLKIGIYLSYFSKRGGLGLEVLSLFTIPHSL